MGLEVEAKKSGASLFQSFTAFEPWLLLLEGLAGWVSPGDLLTAGEYILVKHRGF